MQDTQHRRGARRGGTSGVGVGGAGEALRGLNLRCPLGEPFVVDPRGISMGQREEKDARYSTPQGSPSWWNLGGLE